MDSVVERKYETALLNNAGAAFQCNWRRWQGRYKLLGERVGGVKEDFSRGVTFHDLAPMKNGDAMAK